MRFTRLPTQNFDGTGITMNSGIIYPGVLISTDYIVVPEDVWRRVKAKELQLGLYIRVEYLDIYGEERRVMEHAVSIIYTGGKQIDQDGKDKSAFSFCTAPVNSVAT